MEDRHVKWFNNSSDTDLAQSLELTSEIAQRARQKGDKKKEAEAHETMNGMLDEAGKRGWFRR